MRVRLFASALLAVTGLLVGCQKTETKTDPTPSAAPETPPPPSAATPSAVVENTEPAPSASAAPSAEPAAAGSAKLAGTSAPAGAKSAATAAAPASAATTAAALPSASAAPARVVKTVGGTSASGDGYSVSISAPSPVKVGETATASVSIRAKDPFHCNPKYPYKFALDSGSASYPSNPVRGASVNGKTASMGVPFSPTATGKTTVSGTLSFSVCTEDKCMIEKSKLSVTVDAD